MTFGPNPSETPLLPTPVGLSTPAKIETPPPDNQPEIPTPSPTPPTETSTSDLITGLILLAGFFILGVGFVVAAIVFFVKKIGACFSPARPLETLSSSDPTLSYQTQLAQDGFWITTNCEPGTWLAVSWFANHLRNETQIQYEPGAIGHFIYTGNPPSQIQLSHCHESGMIPPQPVIPPPLPVTHHTHSSYYTPSAY